MKAYFYLTVIVIVGLLESVSCTKDSVSTRNGKDPYRDTVTPAVVLDRSRVSPSEGKVGDVIMVYGNGFAKHKDKLSILFNGQPATIISVTDSTATVKVPALASTGNISAQVEQEYSFGPSFRVDGPMSVDQTFPSVRGANNTIQNILPLDGGQYLIVGDFTNYDNANIDGGINRVARINGDGTLDHNFEYGKLLGGGFSGSPSTVSAAASVSGGKYLVAGGFASYDNYAYVNSIALLNQDGSLDTMTVSLPSGDTMEVSALKGGISGSINTLHVQSDGKILVTGLFRYYVSLNHSLTTVSGRDSLHLDSTIVNYIARLNADGSLDTTYNYDLTNHRGNVSVDGVITSSLLQSDGKLIIVGNFTKYNGQAANKIARLNPDGSLDNTFESGAGADQAIYDISVQPDGKYIIAGTFNSYNHQAANRIARINPNGSIDPSFAVGLGPDGVVTKTSVLPQGQVLVSGIFVNFDNIVRNGFVVLNANGTINDQYNTNGGLTTNANSFAGVISGFIQLPAEKAFLAIGSFTQFDGYSCNRIMKITYQ